MSASCLQAVPLAETPGVRTAAQLPIHLADGREAASTIYSFHGLSDGKEHFACASATAIPMHRWCGCIPNA